MSAPHPCIRPCARLSFDSIYINCKKFWHFCTIYFQSYQAKYKIFDPGLHYSKYIPSRKVYTYYYTQQIVGSETLYDPVCSSVGWAFGQLISWSTIIFLKGREVSPLSYVYFLLLWFANICLTSLLSFMINRKTNLIFFCYKKLVGRLVSRSVVWSVIISKKSGKFYFSRDISEHLFSLK